MQGQVLELPVIDTIKAAWDKVLGSKKTFWAALGIVFGIMFTIGVLESITEKQIVITSLLQITGNILGYFLQLGILYIGIARAKDLPIDYKMLFTAFNLELLLRIIGLYVLQSLILLIPAIAGAIGAFFFYLGSILASILGVIIITASIIGGLILLIRLSLSIAFVLDTPTAPLAAIKKSITATDGNTLNLAGIFVLQILIVLVSAIPLGIGLIWSIPFSMICYGLVYKQLRLNA